MTTSIDAGTLSALAIVLTTVVNTIKPLMPKIDARLILLCLTIISSLFYGQATGSTSVDEYIQIVMTAFSAVGLYEVTKSSIKSPLETSSPDMEDYK